MHHLFLSNYSMKSDIHLQGRTLTKWKDRTLLELGEKGREKDWRRFGKMSGAAQKVGVGAWDFSSTFLMNVFFGRQTLV